MKDIKNIIERDLFRLKNEHNFYGSKRQIENENKIVAHFNIEMEYNESIEEYYKRINDGI